MSNSLFPSDPFFLLDFPGPETVEGRFKYRYFESTERYDETATYLNRMSERDLNIKGAARSIKLSISSLSIEKTGQFDEVATPEHYEYILTEWIQLYDEKEYPEIGTSINSEFDIQKNGYIKLDFDSQNVETQLFKATDSPTLAKMDIYQRSISNIGGPDEKTLKETLLDVISSNE